MAKRATGLTTLNEVRRIFRAHSISIAYVKELSPKQDNQKNQIYLGKGLRAVTNDMPATYSDRGKSSSRNKRKSKAGEQIIQGSPKFFWIGPCGNLHPAPKTKLIEYFQYPEVRLSGFSKGASWYPGALRRDEQ